MRWYGENAGLGDFVVGSSVVDSSVVGSIVVGSSVVGSNVELTTVGSKVVTISFSPLSSLGNKSAHGTMIAVKTNIVTPIHRIEFMFEDDR